MEVGDSSEMGPAPKKRNPVGHATLEVTESCKGVNFLRQSIHPFKASLCYIFRITVGGPWVEEGGREGKKSSTVVGQIFWSQNIWPNLPLDLVKYQIDATLATSSLEATTTKTLD